MDSPFSAAEILEHSHADPADDCSHSHSLQAQRAQKQVSDGYPDGNLDQVFVIPVRIYPQDMGSR